MLVAGIDIGNATTEVALAEQNAGATTFLASSIVPTTGIKGTPQNLPGMVHALEIALGQAGRPLGDLGLIRINEAAPVIGDVAMETITQTVITESTMIGHNPGTPGGLGIGVGVTIGLDDLAGAGSGPWIVVADASHPFAQVAATIDWRNKTPVPQPSWHRRSCPRPASKAHRKTCPAWFTPCNWRLAKPGGK